MQNDPFIYISYNQTRYLSFERLRGTRPHRHSFYKVIIVISGSGDFSHGGQNYPLQSGDLLIANPDTYHEIKSSKGDALKLYVLCFFCTLQSDESNAQRQAQLDQTQLREFQHHHLNHLPGQAHLVPLFEHAMMLMRQQPEYPNNRFYHEATLLLISQIMAALACSIPSSKADYSEQLHRARVVATIENKLDKVLRIGGLAKACGMSERNLRRRWSSWSTRSLTDEILYRRIERACQLLLLPDMSIAEAGCQVGIHSAAQFSRLFKKVKKLSPGAYRRLHLSKHPESLPLSAPFATEFLESTAQADND